MPAEPSICDVLPSAAAALGVPGANDRLGLADELRGVRRIVLVLVDGMGLHLLPDMAPHAPLIASIVRGGTEQVLPMRCTFPSTTPASLVSLGTGVAPGEHGILGFTVNVPGTDRVLTHILWRNDPPPAEWAPAPTWFERTAHAGVDTRAVLPALFHGSGLTYAAYRGARFCGVAEGADYAAALVAEIADIKAGPGLVFGYTPVLDTAAHAHGIASAQWQQAAADGDKLLTRVAENLPADAALLVTADHGGLDVPLAGRPDIDTDPRLAAGVRVVAGEPRVRYLHTVPGAAADVIATWQEVLGADVLVRAREEVVASGLFGPVPEQHLERIGDVVVLSRGRTVVLASAHEPPEVSRLIGFHGSDDPVEIDIPLLTLRG